MENEIKYSCPKCGTLHYQVVANGSRTLLTKCEKCGSRIKVKIPHRYAYHALEVPVRALPVVTCPKCGRLEAIPKAAQEVKGATKYEYNCPECGLKIVARFRNRAARPLQ